jgi:hypothetical protein
MLARALYPIYVFLGAACLVGFTTGVIGKNMIMGFASLWKSKTDDTVVKERGRNRKRKDVGAQSYYDRRQTKKVSDF